MASGTCCYSCIKSLALVILIVAIGIPIYYNSTNPAHLQIRVIHSLLSLKHAFVPDLERPKLTADYRGFESIFKLIPRVHYDPKMDPLVRANAMRAAFSFGKTIPRPAECRFQKETFTFGDQTADGYWINHLVQNKDLETDRILIYFHGGGYMLGDFEAYSGFECHISRLFNMSVIHVEYRRVPEYPLPQPIEDALIVYRALLQRGIASTRFVIMGDSAGGGLILLAAQAMVARQLPLPRAVVAISPWTDLSSSGESFLRNRHIDVMLHVEEIPWMIDQALGPNRDSINRNDPSHSPVFGTFKNFPPLYITVGTAEILEDDARRVADKARQENVDVTLEAGEHLMHVYPLFHAYFREARDTLDNIRQWLNQKFQ